MLCYYVKTRSRTNGSSHNNELPERQHHRQPTNQSAARATSAAPAYAHASAAQHRQHTRSQGHPAPPPPTPPNAPQHQQQQERSKPTEYTCGTCPSSYVLNATSTAEAYLAQCNYGSPFQKYTLILASGSAARALVRHLSAPICSCAGHAEHAIGARAALSAAYPPRLCLAIAEFIEDATS